MRWPLPQARRVIGNALGHFVADDGWAMASHVALSSLMSLFPFAIFLAALAGFLGRADLANRAAELLFSAWPEPVAGPIAAEVQRVVDGASGGVLTISAIIAFYLASNAVEAARTALNRAYRVVERRNVLLLRGQSLLFVATGAIAALLLAVAGALGTAAVRATVDALPALAAVPRPAALVGVVVASAMFVGALVAAHLWLPAGRPHPTRLWPGITLTLVLWLVAGWVFAVYVRSFASSAATYAGLAGVATAIFFLYVVAVALIFGAEFNAALNRQRMSHDG